MLRNGTEQPLTCPAPAQCTKADCGQSICGKSASWFYCILKAKLVLVFPLGVWREPHQFPDGGFSGEEKVISPVPRFRVLLATHWAFLLGLVCMSIKEELHQHHEHSERVALVQEAHLGLATWPRGLVAVWRVWLQTRACLCVSPLWCQPPEGKCGTEGTWPRVLKPASQEALAYMGEPMETSQSDTDDT